MDAIHQQFHVGFRYPVHFTRRVFAADNPLVASLLTGDRPGIPADVVAIVDDGVALAHPRILADIDAYARRHAATMRLPVRALVVQGGEDSKNDRRHLDAILARIHDAQLCRHSYVVAIGGGALLDVAGYATATAHRGLRLVRVPTTVLAQDDSAMGVKNGINAFGLKNYLGVFAPPYAVINDLDFLPTLSDRDWLGGLSEAIKVALVKDAAFFDEIERDAAALVGRDLTVMDRVVRRSSALHLAHIAASGDAFESGASRPLDFGHWAAHRLESITSGGLRHGEAVAIGLALDSTYAHLVGLLDERDWRRIIDLLQALHLSIYVPALDEDNEALLRGLSDFREHLGGPLTVLLLQGIGRPIDVHEIDTGVMIRAMALLKAAEASRALQTGRAALVANGSHP